MAIGSRLVLEAKSRRCFRAWASLTSRKTLYAIVKGRLDEVAISLERDGRGAEAVQMRDVSPHWLRHTCRPSSSSTAWPKTPCRAACWA